MQGNAFDRRAVVLVDPVSTGRFLKQYVVDAGYRLISVFTLSEETLLTSGKYEPRTQRTSGCDLVIESADRDAVLAALAACDYEIVGVVAASEPGVELADHLADALGLPGNRTSTTPARRNKCQTRMRLRAAGLPGPRFAACTSVAELEQFARSVAGRTVLKTPSGAGAHHVFVCGSARERQMAFERIMREPDIFGTQAEQVLAEEHVEGQQWAVELFADSTDVHLMALWRFDFVPSGTGTPRFDRATLVIRPEELGQFTAIVSYAKDVARCVGLELGPALVELRTDPKRGPMLIEAASRLAGIDLPLLVRASASFDPFEATIAAAVAGARYRFPRPRFKKHAALVFCPIEASGRIVAYHGLDAIAALPSFVCHKLYHRVGATLSGGWDLASIPLYVYLAHSDRDTLEHDCARVRVLFDAEMASA